MIYGQSYFENAAFPADPRPEAYSYYKRQKVKWVDDPDDQGENFKTQHWKFFNRYREMLEGKRVLELGCAKGFCTADLREFGADCVGIDGDSWVINEAVDREAIGYTSLQSLLEYLPTLEDNAFDTIIGLRMIPCLADQDIEAVLPHILRVAQNRIFIVDDRGYYEEFYTPERQAIAEGNYNVKYLGEWQQLMPGCIIGSYADPIWVT